MTASLIFPEATDRTIPSVADSAGSGSSATDGNSTDTASDGSHTLSAAQRESAIDRAQRRARVHKEAYSASLHEYLQTGRRVFLDVAHIHRMRQEECERQANELIEGRA
jgi:hypothetical protein